MEEDHFHVNGTYVSNGRWLKMKLVKFIIGDGDKLNNTSSSDRHICPKNRNNLYLQSHKVRLDRPTDLTTLAAFQILVLIPIPALGGIAGWRTCVIATAWVSVCAALRSFSLDRAAPLDHRHRPG